MKNLGISILMVGLLSLLLISGCYIEHGNKQTLIVTVTNKEWHWSGGKRNGFLIYATDAQGKQYIFENHDDLFNLKFGSIFKELSIEVGRKYRVTVNGLRIDLLSKYPNIVSIENVNEN